MTPIRALRRTLRDGDREAFAELVVRYQRPIYNAAYWVLRRAEDASDIAQNVFLRVAERLDEYDSRYRFFSWIYRIAVNESLNLLRRNGHEEALDDEIDFPGRTAPTPNGRSATRSCARIRGALMRMSANDRMVLALRHFSECSYQEIATDPGNRREDGEVPPVRSAAAPAQMLKDLRPELT